MRRRNRRLQQWTGCVINTSVNDWSLRTAVLLPWYSVYATCDWTVICHLWKAPHVMSCCPCVSLPGQFRGSVLPITPAFQKINQAFCCLEFHANSLVEKDSLSDLRAWDLKQSCQAQSGTFEAKETANPRDSQLWHTLSLWLAAFISELLPVNNHCENKKQCSILHVCLHSLSSRSDLSMFNCVIKGQISAVEWCFLRSTTWRHDYVPSQRIPSKKWSSWLRVIVFRIEVFNRFWNPGWFGQTKQGVKGQWTFSLTH